MTTRGELPERVGRRPVMGRSSGARRGVRLPALALVVLMAVAGLGAAAGSVAAQSEGDEDQPSTTEPPAAETTDDEATDDAQGDEAQQEARDQLLRDGAAVYSQMCQACHQPGGAGLPGSYPPLLDNPNVGDADYVRATIANGKQGELVVNGETYNGVMPSFSTLAADDVDALIVYIQSGFEAPSAPAAESASGPVAGTELPALADMGAQAAFLIAALVILLVVGPRLTSRNDRLDTPWFDTWLKTAAVVVATVLAIAYIPNWVLQTSTVAGLDRPLQDLIGVSVWGLGLALCLGGLWFAHRDSRL